MKKYAIYLILLSTVFIHIQAGFAAPLGGDFKLTNMAGQTIALSDYRGQVVILNFGFLSCPDVCPTTLAELKQVVHALSVEQQQRLQVLFITVDPERDTAEQLKTYLQHFNPHFMGLRGSVGEVRQVCQQYGTDFRHVPLADNVTEYRVEHASQLFLINPEGQLVRLIPYGTPSAVIVQYIQTLLAQPNLP
ncbi:uncharacterized protein SCO1/SenC/PrrC, involved in biogenesis of respiratory and photosynthetic systems [Beggiatoa alba B18LD]|uniref:Uncharacterized protein SCO1/SenC/PrrC, involved in biogenesis of respiratory and photosynthetic systems n=2 Tax=Beggiatoa alba TaxID=1022 RepID=U5FCE5_9GAMM|nr:uncharacterized protein SCO1/SenC/PrrC, involved in biogenesis of respiratory and photosynthetic systems [Beggiatoa alba B18LD]